MYKLKCFLLIGLSIFKWIYSNWIDYKLDSYSKSQYIPFKVFFETSPLIYFNFSILNKFLTLFYSLAIPFIVIKITQPIWQSYLHWIILFSFATAVLLSFIHVIIKSFKEIPQKSKK